MGIAQSIRYGSSYQNLLIVRMLSFPAPAIGTSRTRRTWSSYTKMKTIQHDMRGGGGGIVLVFI